MPAKPRRRKKKPQRSKGSGSIYRLKNSKFWWVAYVSGGKRCHESTKSTRKKDAQDLLTQRLGDIARGVVVTPRLGKITLDAGLKGVVKNLEANGRDESAVDVRARINNHILKHFNPDRRMAAIMTSDLEAYVALRKTQEGASASTINHELAAIKRAYRLAYRGGEIATPGPYIPMLTVDNVRTGFLERDQFEAVRAALPEALRGVVTFAYLTAWRLSAEVLPLTWPQVDRERRVIRLEPGTTKNKKGRTLPYGELPELVAVIDAAWAEHERLEAAGTICPLVFHRDGAEIRSIRKAWSSACETAGCPGKLVHDMRRSGVRNLVRAGVPEHTAMAISGHKTRSIFDRYDIVVEDDIRIGLGKLAAKPSGQPASPKVRNIASGRRPSKNR